MSVPLCITACIRGMSKYFKLYLGIPNPEGSIMPVLAMARQQQMPQI
ncbi:MAG: hypothetical protein WBA39_13095 [Rivularia sp. (in: cyanobacteria)]